VNDSVTGGGGGGLKDRPGKKSLENLCGDQSRRKNVYEIRRRTKAELQFVGNKSLSKGLEREGGAQKRRDYLEAKFSFPEGD